MSDAPKRGLPPRHLADRSAEERRAAVAELGKTVVEWRARAKLAGWSVDGWDHIKRLAA